MVEITVEEAAGKAKVAPDTCSNNLEQTIDRAQRFAKIGCDYVVVFAPFLVLPNQAGLVDFYRRVADACPVPIVIHNAPERVGVNVEPKTYAKLIGPRQYRRDQGREKGTRPPGQDPPSGPGEKFRGLYGQGHDRLPADGLRRQRHVQRHGQHPAQGDAGARRPQPGRAARGSPGRSITPITTCSPPCAWKPTRWRSRPPCRSWACRADRSGRRSPTSARANREYIKSLLKERGLL